MRNMKKWLALVLAGTMVMSLAGCGNDDASKTSGSGDSSAEVTPEPSGDATPEPSSDAADEGENGGEEEFARVFDKYIQDEEPVDLDGYVFTVVDYANSWWGPEDGKRYSGIGYYEECGDIGNEYIFIQNPGSKPIATRGMHAQIELAEDEAYRCTYRITHRLMVPESADETLEREQRQCMDLYQRKAGRSRNLAELTITTLLRLERSAKGLKVETTIDNTAKDHRIRVMVPTGLQAETHFADSTFEVVERPNRHGKAWQNPSACEHQQNFVAMNDERDGILVANFGLYEYEILPDMDNTIAVTLLRCTREMGDWGVFPAPAAQLLGVHTVAYEIVPYKKEKTTAAFAEGHLFQTELAAVSLAQIRGYLKDADTAESGGEKALPPKAGFFAWTGEGLNLTSFKKKDGDSDIIIRFVNETKDAVELTIDRQDWFGGMYRSNVIEERLGAIPIGEDSRYHMTVKPFEIFTVGVTAGTGASALPL